MWVDQINQIKCTLFNKGGDETWVLINLIRIMCTKIKDPAIISTKDSVPHLYIYPCL